MGDVHVQMRQVHNGFSHECTRGLRKPRKSHGSQVWPSLPFRLPALQMITNTFLKLVSGVNKEVELN